MDNTQQNIPDIPYPDLTEEELLLVKRAQEDPAVLKFLIDEVYEEQPVGLEEFICGQQYLKQDEFIFYTIRAILSQVFDPGIREAFTISGLGSGKSTIGALFLAFNLYRLNCLKQPQTFFNLRPTTTIVTLNVSISKEQAQLVVFDDLLGMLATSPWFKNRFTNRKRDLYFNGKRIRAVSGHSGTLQWKGFATFCAVLDEADFFYDKRGHSNADIMESVLLGSMTTRFPRDYKYLAISSVNTEKHYMTRRFNQVADGGTPIDIPINHVKPFHLELGDTFSLPVLQQNPLGPLAVKELVNQVSDPSHLRSILAAVKEQELPPPTVFNESDDDNPTVLF